MPAGGRHSPVLLPPRDDDVEVIRVASSIRGGETFLRNPVISANLRYDLVGVVHPVGSERMLSRVDVVSSKMVRMLSCYARLSTE